MRTYARIAGGVVAEIIGTDGPVEILFPPPLVLIDVTELAPQPTTGWSYDGKSFTAPTPPTPPMPTLAQQAGTMLENGCQISSTSAPALNGTYAADDATQRMIIAEITSIMLNATFTDGTTAIEWDDITKQPHDFSVAQFKTFATAHAAFVTACLRVISGKSTALPAQHAMIA